MRGKHAGRIALPCGGGGKKCVWNSYTPRMTITLPRKGFTSCFRDSGLLPPMPHGRRTLDFLPHSVQCLAEWWACRHNAGKGLMLRPPRAEWRLAATFFLGLAAAAVANPSVAEY